MKSEIVFILFHFFILSSTHLVKNMNRLSIKEPDEFKTLDLTLLPKVEHFEQKLNHFEQTDNRIWSQRYWVNPTFHKPGGPAFLIIMGESPANPGWLVRGEWISYAEENNALCFLVEHRFYGESKPVLDLSIENLKYLNSEQALADLAYFINGMNEKYKSVSISKWIAFGGSYSGTLAAWLRQKYPNLVYGAVTTSAPLKAKVDFYEYLQVVKDSLASYQKECADEVRKANIQLSKLVKKQSWSKIEEKFKLCKTVKNPKETDIETLFAILSANFSGVVQYNKINVGGSHSKQTIDNVCDIMTTRKSSKETALDRYAAANQFIMSFGGEECLSLDYEGYIEYMKETSWKSQSANERLWFYQTCTEFGFYQTSRKSTDLFGPHLPVTYFIKQCEEIYEQNFNEQFLKNAVSRTNILYGEFHVNVGNIIFVNGSIDPWHALSLTKTAPDETYDVIYIEGTAHCADIYPPSPLDSKQLTEARNKIRSIIKSWLSDDKIKGESSKRKHPQRKWNF